MNGFAKQDYLDAFYLAQTIHLARFAPFIQEIPVAAIVTVQNKVIAQAFNLKEHMQQPSFHAEVLAINQAARYLGTWRLNEATLYTSLEPCPMCAGAILQSRIKRVVYAAKDLKWGALETKLNLLDLPFNHQTEYRYLACQTASNLLRLFFQSRRKDKTC